MALKITDENYEPLKKVFAIICNHTIDPQRITPDTDPILILNSWEKMSRSLAKKGLKESLRDSISSLTYYPPNVIAQISADLEQENLPSINQLLAVIRDTVKKVLSTRSIRTLDQYYIIKELIDDTASEIGLEDRRQLSRCLEDFEQTRSAGKK